MTRENCWPTNLTMHTISAIIAVLFIILCIFAHHFGWRATLACGFLYPISICLVMAIMLTSVGLFVVYVTPLINQIAGIK